MSLNWTSVTSPTQIFSIANTASSWFWVAILIVLIVIVFIVLANYGSEIAGITSLFIGLISSVFMTYMDLIDWKFVLVVFSFFLFLILYVYWSSTRENV